MNDDPARPSLLLAKHERAHREHLNHQHQHQHHHKLLRRDEADVTATAIESVVTEITATVSVIQQIDVDSNGSTFSILTILAHSTPAAPTGTAETAASTTSSAIPGSVPPSSLSASSTNSQISSASQSLNSTSPTTSSSSTPSKESSSFASLIGTSNSTTLISSSGGSSTATPNFSNSSISSITSSSSSFEFSSTSSSSFSEESTSSTTSISSLYSPSSSSSATATGYGAGGIGGGTARSTASTATSTAGPAGDGSNSPNTPTPVVVGGVVGSVAGAAILVFLLLAFIRWKKRHQSMLSLGSGNEGPSGAITSRDGPQPDAPSGGMSERRSLAFVPAALVSLTGFNKRSSRQTDRTISSTAGSERGFYRVSGRKLPSVMQSGGDGYGGGIPESNTLSGTSFYRDSQGFYGGSSAAGTSGVRPESGVPVMRPSPARTPITQQGPFSAAAAPLTPPRRPDGLGRSHPSQDGSHTSSRFTEDV